MEGERIELRYGRERVAWRPPAGIDWSMLQPVGRSAFPAECEVIDRGLDELCAALASANCRGGRCLLVIPDRTRRCRLETVLPPLLDRLESRFHLDCSALVASGSHRLLAAEDHSDLLGAVARRLSVAVHDCDDEAQLEAYGQTAAGTPLRLNRRLGQTDWVVAVAAVRYHYFAGYGGGPKMIVPGLAGRETIRRNHGRMLADHGADLHPACREGCLDGNPVWEDLADGARRAGPVFSLQLALAAGDRIADARGGPLEETQRRLLPEVDRCQAADFTAPADVVVASAGGFPADIDLVQAHKAIHHAFRAVRPGGALVILAACEAGIGSDTFLEWFTASSAGEMAGRLRRDFTLNGNTALALRRKCEAARIALVSQLSPELVRRTGLLPAVDIDEAWKLVTSDAPAPKRGYLVFDAAATVPRPVREVP